MFSDEIMEQILLACEGIVYCVKTAEGLLCHLISFLFILLVKHI